MRNGEDFGKNFTSKEERDRFRAEEDRRLFEGELKRLVREMKELQRKNKFKNTEEYFNGALSCIRLIIRLYGDFTDTKSEAFDILDCFFDLQHNIISFDIDDYFDNHVFCKMENTKNKKNRNQ